MTRSLASAVLVVAILGGCGAGGERAGSSAPGEGATRPTASTAPAPPPAAAQPRLADRVVDLGSATYDEAEHQVDERVPVALQIGALDIVDAPVLAVGVDAHGELDVPGPADVGWYRYGPRPGEPGTTVLAAHIAFDGVDGLFRHLDELAPGDEVVVRMDDGTARTYRIADLEQHPKQDLPPEIWAKDGAERLALVTCGGSFDPARSSYRDNVIAWAVPA